MNNSVGIIGAGWLGKVLAQTLMGRGFSVTTTAQSNERLESLRGDDIAAEKFCLPFDFIKNDISHVKAFLQKTLVVCIPPQLKKGRIDYPLKISQIVRAAELGKVEHLILLSTTAIYNGLSGEVDESSSLQPEAEKVAVLLEAEENASAFKGRTSVLRLAGLIGPNRHPGQFFRKGRTLKDPQVCVNLIHQTDVIGLILGLIESESCSGTFNGVSATHISKGQFYQMSAQSLNIDEHSCASPTKLQEGLFNGAFDDTQENKLEGKIIKGEKIKAELNYQFCFDDLIKWLHVGAKQDVI